MHLVEGCGGHPRSVSFTLREMGVVFSSAETQSNLCFKQITPAALLKMDGGREACEETMGIIQAKGDSGLDQAVK